MSIWERGDPRALADPRNWVCASLPSSRIPGIAVGHNSDGQLIVTAVDGRQEDSSGAAID